MPMAVDPKNPFGSGAGNPYVVNQTPNSPQPPAPAAPAPQLGVDEDEVNKRPMTTKPRQRPGGAPAPGSSVGVPVGVQQGFASLQITAVCNACGAEADGPIGVIASMGRCGLCGSTDIGLPDEIDKTAVDERQNYSCRNCGREITHTSDGWIHVGGDAYCNQSAGDAKAAPKESSKTSSSVWDRQTMNAGTGDGYYVLKMSVAIDGPYDNASDAYGRLPIVGGDAVQFLEAGKVSRGPTTLDHPVRFGNPVTSSMINAKAAEIASGIVTTNPSMDRKEAFALAHRTIERFPGVLGRTAIMSDADYMRQLGKEDALQGRPKDPQANHPAYDAAYEVWKNHKKTSASDRVEYDMKGGGPSTMASVIAKDIGSIPSGESREFVVNGKGFTVYYDEQGATGDSGAPVRGDVTGDFEVYSGLDGPMGLKRLGDVHVSPHGSSGYGNPQAKSYAVEQVANMIARAAA